MKSVRLLYFCLFLFLPFLSSSEVYEFKCDPMGFDDQSNNTWNGNWEYYKISIDTEKEEMLWEWKGKNEAFPDSLILEIIEIQSDRFIIFKQKHSSNDQYHNPSYVGRLDIDKFISVQLEPVFSQGWDMRCIEVNANKSDNLELNKVIPASSGSGFLISKNGHLVSNYHVVEDCDLINVYYQGKKYPAGVSSFDKFNDLSLLKIDLIPNAHLNLSNSDVNLLDDIIVAGFPLGKEVSSSIKIHKGNVTSLSGFEDNFSNFQTDATINQGNSGGPIFDLNGNIVGVAAAYIKPEYAQNTFFAIKSSTLRTFLNSNAIYADKYNNTKLSNSDIGNLILKTTVYIECSMTQAKINEYASGNSLKALFIKN